MSHVDHATRLKLFRATEKWAIALARQWVRKNPRRMRAASWENEDAQNVALAEAWRLTAHHDQRRGEFTTLLGVAVPRAITREAAKLDTGVDMVTMPEAGWDGFGPVDGPAETAEVADEYERVKRALRFLPPMDRRVLLDYFGRGEDMASIGRREGRSRELIRFRRNRALKRVRAALGVS